MIPVVTGVRLTGAADREELPLLVLGPSLGTSAADLWTACADGLTDAFDVFAWDLPGHGHNRSVPDEGFTIGELAQGVLSLVADIQEQRGDADDPFAYAGVAVGGEVGLALLLDHAERVSGAALINTGARILDVGAWTERIGRVSTSGTAVLVSTAAERWFAHDFFEREPDRGAALLHSLHVADDTGYIRVCEALAHFDVRARLAEITQPVLAIAGNEDRVTPPDLVREIATTTRNGRLVVLEGAAHLAPAERPAEVAALLREHFLGERARSDPAGSFEDGLALRREVLGDEYVDRALGTATDLTRDFQEFVTTQAWGAVWTRPGLDRRSRSMITLTALVAGGHQEELALHLRGARRNGLSWEEIKEVLVQTAVYCGVPAANTAFRIAQRVHDEEDS